MGRFILKKTATGCKFDLLAANGQVIAASEVYKTRAACLKGIESVRNCAAAAKAADLTEGDPKAACPRFEIYKDKAGLYRFRLRARNGAIIAASDGYSSKSACENGIESVRRNAPDAAAEEV